ncbi:unnamed protein product (macronuclear) [Paramecium tetraurelia]|uniref:Chromosome undetermined scaffold_131, whole genome shotgun sequence n=1 Tax=Paramecium tetraurelia TaxID=5888 RepID=Q3SDL9_PARTE|nr:uncharacterized protein GSPATT00032718001 [Paramecium tetraurelia]CAI39339.1 rab_B32 [Paramecium tetraurelia]CAK62866.1 unnamed protein product [Paramecium tetraurelia]|eukprot:XP_001430264.1 hypothetical protein (macronuclear) [Paramecium tetraurelia strain d4-2]
MSTSANKSKAFAKFKIVFIGNQAVGKTSIIARFVYEQIPEQHQPTIGIDFLSKCIQVDNKTVRLQLWDTAGQERFRSLIPSYIRDSHAAVLCYDVSNAQSFADIKAWLDYVREERGSDVVGVLIANKIDIKDRVVTTQEGEKLAQEQDLLYYEVSAKEGTNVQQTFKNLALKLLGPIQDVEQPTTEIEQSTNNNNNIQIKPQDKQTPQSDQQKCQC